jgi:uncharacterized membrane protein (DUF485 family)
MADDAHDHREPSGSARSARNPSAGPPAASPDALLGAIMRRQARLSVGVALIFLVLVLGLPVVNHYLPGLAQSRIAGFTATWLFLGLLFYPITWLLSAYFVRASEEVEHEIARRHRSDVAEARMTAGGEEAERG